MVGNVDPLRDLGGLLDVRGDELATGDSSDYKGGKCQIVLFEKETLPCPPRNANHVETKGIRSEV